MENISHSLPKRSFSSISNGAFTSHKSVYDDVFGGPPRFGLPTLAPRLEDYSEIFGGFHAARSSSIPVLDLPLIGDDTDLYFDVRSLSFDYTEVFGNSRSLDYTASFQDLVEQPSRCYASSDDRSPERSGSLSDELEPLSGSDMSHRLSDGDLDALASIKQFNVSYNKSTVVTETSHVTNLSAVPGYTFSHCDSPGSWNGEDEHCSIEDGNCSEECDGRVRKEKHYNNCSSNPLYSDFNAHGNEFDPLEKHINSNLQDKPFITVSDISLRTKPSRLPPPSRPPPAFVAKKGEFDKSNSKIRASKSCTFERVADNSAPLYFDVEVDATLYGEGREKESVERKKVQSHTSMPVEEKTSKTVGASGSSIQDDKMLQSHGKDTRVSGPRPPAIKDRIGSLKSTGENPGSRQMQYGNHTADNSGGAVAWREATEYFEVIEQNISRQAFDRVDDFDTSMQHMRHQKTTDVVTCNQNEDSKKFEVTIETHRWDEERKQPEMTRYHFDMDNKHQKEISNKKFTDQQALNEKEILNKVIVLDKFQQLGENEMIQNANNETVEGRPDTQGKVSEMEDDLKLKASLKRKDTKERCLDAQTTKEDSAESNQNILSEECQRRLSGGAQTRGSAMERTEPEVVEKLPRGVSERENENKLSETHVLIENRMILKLNKDRVGSGKKLYIDAGHEKIGNGQFAYVVKKENERLMEVGKQKLIDLKISEALEQAGNGKEHKLVCETEVIKVKNDDACRIDGNDLRFRMAMAEEANEGKMFEMKQDVNLCKDADVMEDLSEHAEVEPIDRNEHEREVKWDVDSHVQIEREHHDIQMLELNGAVFQSGAKVELKSELSGRAYASEAEIDDTLVKGKFNSFSKNKDELQDGENHCLTNNMESPSSSKVVTDSNVCSSRVEMSCARPDKVSPVECSHGPEKIMSTENDEGQMLKGTQIMSKRVDRFTPSQVIRDSLVNGRHIGDASSAFYHSDDTLYSVKKSISQKTERKDNNMKANDQKVDERIRRENELETERLRKIEEEMEREREREKDRMAVDKAALEARERSYVEARERVERTAVERATAEVRQRAIAGARERLEKASIEARLRSERAVVERVTAEARQRAVQKSMAQKGASDAHDHVERSVPDMFSASLRYADTRQSSLSSDLHQQSTGIPNGLRYSYSSAHVEADGESPQRCKARLERYKRTAERAANALAEKNRRDLLAQREREERNRVAEALDTEVKRWSSGKEGNLRALLSTLQYILGPDSGWQPLPLTEVITCAGVKKAYRKATLCVHPDKLQQRGATIHQKYICEKVFDLLKEAWNKFNSEER